MLSCDYDAIVHYEVREFALRLAGDMKGELKIVEW